METNTMNIIVFGATGDIGSRIVSEALQRGHKVTAVTRNEAAFSKLPDGVKPVAANLSDADKVASVMTGHDLAITALRPPAGEEAQLPVLTQAVVQGAAHHQMRVLIVGGAARLMIPGTDGETVLNAEGFLPASAVEIARACQVQYEQCLASQDVIWSYLSPAAMIAPGTRTGQYTLGTNTLVTDSNGQSRISMEDFAVAMLDEAETPKHLQQAFTVGYQ